VNDNDKETYKKYLKEDKQTSMLIGFMAGELDKKLLIRDEKHNKKVSFLFPFLGFFIPMITLMFTLFLIKTNMPIIFDNYEGSICFVMAIIILAPYLTYFVKSGLLDRLQTLKVRKSNDWRCVLSIAIKQIQNNEMSIEEFKTKYIRCIHSIKYREPDEEIIDFVEELSKYAECLQQQKTIEEKENK